MRSNVLRKGFKGIKQLSTVLLINIKFKYQVLIKSEIFGIILTR